MTIALFGLFITFVLLWIFFSFFKLENNLNNRFILARSELNFNITFELVKENWFIHGLQRMVGGANEIKIGDSYFDSKIFISSDFQVVKKILENEEIRDLVQFIVTYPKIQGLYFKNKTAYALYSGNKNTKSDELDRVDDILSPKMDLLVQKMLPLLKKEFVNERRQNRDMAFQIEDLLEKTKNFYWSFFLSSLIVLIFLLSFYNDNVIYIHGVELKPVFFTGSILFCLVTFFLWHKTVGSIRTHNLYLINLFIFLPSCFMVSYIFSHTTNVIFDKSEIHYAVSSYNTKMERGSKNSKRYYVLLKVDPATKIPKDAFFDENMTYKIRISSSMYYRLTEAKSEKLEVYARSGALGYPYIIDMVKK